MILLFNNLPVSESYKIEKMVEKAKSLYYSDFFDVDGKRWLGDDLTVESLFPYWIIKKYQSDPQNVLVVSLIKNYLRWLFSIDYGYGAQLEWENIRVPLYSNSIFLEAFADFYFDGADFSQAPLSNVLNNIRQFSIKAKSEYIDKKGTPEAIKYLICTLLGLSWTDVYVSTGSPGTITIEVNTSKYNDLLTYDSFLKNYVYPAGVVIIYRSV
jgi:hypothetical protein